MASGLDTIQFSGAKNALVNGPVSAGTLARVCSGVSSSTTTPWRWRSAHSIFAAR